LKRLAGTKRLGRQAKKELTMTDYTPNQSTSELITTTGAAWLEVNKQNQNLSAASVEVAINRPLSEVVSACLAAAAADSLNTQKAYMTAIGLFMQHLSGELANELPREWLPLAEPGKDGKRTIWTFRGPAAVLRRVYASTIDKFILWRKSQGDSRKTAALRRGAVRTFLAVAYRDNIITPEQADAIAIDKYQARERNFEEPTGRRLKPAEVRSLREAVTKAQQPSKAERDQTLLDLALFAGLRRDEIAHLTTGNIKQDGGRWWLILRGKGGKVRRVKIHDTLYKSLDTWCSRAALTMGDGDTPLFCNLTKGGKPTGKQLNASVIGRLVAEYGNLAGLAPLHGENCLAPHDLRRTCARNASDHGATLPQVQALLGHSDPKTTIRYIGLMDDDDNTAVDRINYTNGR
jgi:integrase/recombinase XerD